MHLDKRNIKQSISAQLRDSEPVRKALGHLASRGMVGVDDVTAIATGPESQPDLRFDAITAVLAMEQAAEEVLTRLLDSVDRTIFVETLKAVAAFRTKWALPEVKKRLRTCTDPEKRALFAWTLAAYPDDREAENLLREVMATDRDANVREHAIEAAGAFGSGEVVKALLTALETGSPRERFWSLYSLGNLARPETANAVRKYLRDKTLIPGFGTIADEARQALAKITEADS